MKIFPMLAATALALSATIAVAAPKAAEAAGDNVVSAATSTPMPQAAANKSAKPGKKTAKPVKKTARKPAKKA